MNYEIDCGGETFCLLDTFQFSEDNDSAPSIEIQTDDVLYAGFEYPYEAYHTINVIISLANYPDIRSYDFSTEKYPIYLRIYDGCIWPTFDPLTILDRSLQPLSTEFFTIEINQPAEIFYVPMVDVTNSFTGDGQYCEGANYEFVFTPTVIKES